MAALPAQHALCSVLTAHLHSVNLQNLYELLEANLPVEVAVRLVEDLPERLLRLPGVVLRDDGGQRHGDPCLDNRGSACTGVRSLHGCRQLHTALASAVTTTNN